MLLVFINIVGSREDDIFSTCVFNNIVGVTPIFYFPLDPVAAFGSLYKPFIISYIRFMTNHPNLL